MALLAERPDQGQLGRSFLFCRNIWCVSCYSKLLVGTGSVWRSELCRHTARVLLPRFLWSISQWSTCEGLTFDLGMLRPASARNEAESNRRGVWKGAKWWRRNRWKKKKHGIVPFVLFFSIGISFSYVSLILFQLLPLLSFSVSHLLRFK